MIVNIIITGYSKMARPITPTPRLDSKASKRFLKEVSDNLNKPSKPIPTPRLHSAIKIIIADALSSKK
jgi:hypothetical protein